MWCPLAWAFVCLRLSHSAALDELTLSSLHADVLSDENWCTSGAHCTEDQASLALLQRGLRQKSISDELPHVNRNLSAIETVSFEFPDAAGNQNKANAEMFCPKDNLGIPSLCPQGREHWSRAELLQALPEFIDVYKRRPPIGLQSPNHAFALWFTVKKLQPKYIIESGVFQGGSTWLLREAAGPHTKIYSLDPKSFNFLKYVDQGNTTYFIGENFSDFANVAWSQYIPEEDKKNTLVMLDDHMSAIRRVEDLLLHGFEHLWSDDNYRYGEPGQDCYSFNTICAPLAEHKNNGSIIHMHKFKSVTYLISPEEHRQNRELLSQHMEVYFEFPALWNGACRDSEELLYEDELAGRGLPTPSEAKFNYYTSHPPYVKLRP